MCKYAKNVILKNICRICTPHFADVRWRPRPGPWALPLGAHATEPLAWLQWPGPGHTVAGVRVRVRVPAGSESLAGWSDHLIIRFRLGHHPRLGVRDPGPGLGPSRRDRDRLSPSSVPGYIWILVDNDIGVFTDIRSYSDPKSCHMSRYRVFHVTRYRIMSDETRYRVTLTPILTPISGATRYRVIMSPISYTAYPISGSISGPISGYPISGPAIPDIGVNIGHNIGRPDIGA